MYINEKYACTNKTGVKRGRKIEYIVIHYTAGVTSIKGQARNVLNYFKNSDREASADYIVDDGEIILYNGDIENRYTWAVGGTKYTSLCNREAGRLYGICKNNNSVSIEMCSNKTNRKTLSAYDEDWYFTNETMKNTVDLTVYLMKKYKIDIDHVIMHNHVNGKVCPSPWCLNNERLETWYKFKDIVNQFYCLSCSEEGKEGSLVDNGSLEVKGNPVTKENPVDKGNSSSIPFKVKIKVDSLNIRAGAGVNHKINGDIEDKGVYTIIEVNGSWGRLKSKAGWINISDKYVDRL